MNDKEFQLWGLIKQIAAKEGSASNWILYNRARTAGIIPSHNGGREFKKMLMRLLAYGKITEDSVKMSYTPVLSDEEASAEKNEDKGEVKVTDDLIKVVIRRFFMSYQRLPTPREIDDYFRSQIGIPDQKDLPRIVRFRIAEGILTRDSDDGVSYPGMAIAEAGLRRFTA